MGVVGTTPLGSTYGSVVLPDGPDALWRGYEIELEGGVAFPDRLSTFFVGNMGTSMFIEEPGLIHGLQVLLPWVDDLYVSYYDWSGTPLLGRAVGYYLTFRLDEQVLGTVNYVYSARVDLDDTPTSPHVYLGTFTESMTLSDSRGAFTQNESTANAQALAYDGTTSNPLVLYGIPYLNRRGLFGAEVNANNTDPFGHESGLGQFHTAAGYEPLPFGFEIETPCTVELSLQMQFALEAAVGGTCVELGTIGSGPSNHLYLNTYWEPGAVRSRSLVRHATGRIVGLGQHVLWQYPDENRLWALHISTGNVLSSDDEGANWTLMTNAWTDISGAKPLDATAMAFKGAGSIARVGTNIVFRYSPDRGLTWGDPQIVCPVGSLTKSWCVMSHQDYGSDDVTVTDQSTISRNSSNCGEDWTDSPTS